MMESEGRNHCLAVSTSTWEILVVVSALVLCSGFSLIPRLNRMVRLCWAVHKYRIQYLVIDFWRFVLYGTVIYYK